MLRAVSTRLGSQQARGRVSAGATMLGRRAFLATPCRLSSRELFEKMNVQPIVLHDLQDQYGIDLCHDPLLNKGTAFPERERDRLGLRGLVPPRQFNIEEQLQRTYHAFHKSGGTSPQQIARGEPENVVAKHLFLVGLQDRNETLFYRLVCQHIEEMAPIIYTPTVGYACKNAGLLFRRSRGMYFTKNDVGEMHAIIRNWPHRDVDVIVVTDGSRILGLGDLGCHGMGIPIGKLSLYVAAGGVHPMRVMPCLIDVGTDNEELLEDPMYLGIKEKRLRGDAYIEVVDEFMSAARHRFPNALIQFEDFNATWAEPLLRRYRDHFLMFNDDVQGTGSVALAGLITALKCRRLRTGAVPQAGASATLSEQRVVCVGAGSAGLGVCEGLRMGMEFDDTGRGGSHHGNFWVVDKDGLLTRQRPGLIGQQVSFARDDATEALSLLETIRQVKPTVLLGVSGVGGIFTEEVVHEMSRHCEHPIIFAMSNPTVNSEVTAENAYRWSHGKVIYASGSPFDKVTTADGSHWHPTQVNNMFIFPAVGVAASSLLPRKITDNMFYEAAKALADVQPEEELRKGHLLPRVRDIREVTVKVAAAVAKEADREGLTSLKLPPGVDWETHIRAEMYVPKYAPIVHERARV